MTCKLFDIAAFYPESNLRFYACENADLREDNTEYLLATRRVLRSAVLLDATDITDVWQHWLGDRDDVGMFKEFGSCVPPWENTFVYSSNIVLGKNIACMGIHCMKVAGDAMSAQGVRQLRDRYGDSSQYFAVHMWRRFQHQLVAVMDAFPYFAAFRNNGELCGISTLERAQSQVSMSKWSTLGFFAFQLSHCRNIKVEESTYRPLMPKGRRNKAPKISYRTLKIASSISKHTGSDLAGGPEKAKHVCRGNFAHYTEENKLFGKYVGMFWRPMHIRGNAKHGIVGKEYKL